MDRDCRVAGFFAEKYPAQSEQVSLVVLQRNHYLAWAKKFLLEGTEPPGDADTPPKMRRGVRHCTCGRRR